MPTNISRRDVLKSLGVTVSAGSVLRMIPLQAAEHVHRMVTEERAQTSDGAYTPKFFPAHSYQTLRSLCQTIIPPDQKAGGALEAGAPEFIDLLTSENQEYQLTLGGGIAWLDSTCNDRYGKVFLECTEAQQKEVLDQIAYRENARKGSDARARRQVFLPPARPHHGWILHQRNRHQVPGVYWKHLPGGIPGLSSSSRGLARALRKMKGRIQPTARVRRSCSTGCNHGNPCEDENRSCQKGHVFHSSLLTG